MNQSRRKTHDEVYGPICALSDLPRQLFDVTEEVVNHSAFRRLVHISFLGALSPRYRYALNQPSRLSKHYSSSKLTKSDGTRAEHSLHVASHTYFMAERLGLSIEARKYALISALLHDIATWGLSHTGEAAFADITSTSSTKLRTMMICGSRKLPEALSLKKVLKSIGICGETLLSLFSKKCEPTSSDSSEPELSDLYRLWLIIHSPLNPDTLEGIWRTGVTYSVDVPPPDTVIRAFSNSLFGPAVDESLSNHALDFWRSKRRIYLHIINHNDTVEWESKLSRILREQFASLSLAESLELPEDCLVQRICEYDKNITTSVLRYKAPREYSLSLDYLRKKSLGRFFLLNELHTVFLSEPIGQNERKHY